MPILRQGPKLHKLPTGQHLLLDAIWRKHGGLRAAAKKIGIEDYLLNIWRKRGKVPVTRIPLVAKVLDVPMAALNYVAFTLISESSLPWSAVVKNCKLGKDVERKILKAKPPKIQGII